MKRDNIIKIVKALLLELLFITISCFISLIIYGLVTLPLRGVILKLEGTAYEKLYLIAISVLLTIIFSFVMLFFKKKSKRTCENEVSEDYKGESYKGLWNDIKISFVNGDYVTSVLVLLINALAIIFNKADILMLWSPMFFFKTVIGNNIIAHILSSIITLFVYYLFLALYRRKIYKKWHSSLTRNWQKLI